MLRRILILFCIVTSLEVDVFLVAYMNNVKAQNEIQADMAARISSLEQRISEQQEESMQQSITYNKGIYALSTQVQELQQKVDQLAPGARYSASDMEAPDRGGDRLGDPVFMNCTAYSLDERCCGKTPKDPEYGITYSGEYVREWYTIAAGPELKLGTKVYIPYFKDMPNNGIFVVMDRGANVTEGHLDIYMTDYDACLEFGRQDLEVYILPGRVSE